MGKPKERVTPSAAVHVQPGTFGVYFDGSMIAFANAVPRRITLHEADNLCASILATAYELSGGTPSDVLANVFQELASELRARANQQHPEGANNHDQ